MHQIIATERSKYTSFYTYNRRLTVAQPWANRVLIAQKRSAHD